MSTPAGIGILDQHGNYRARTVNFDGYPTGVGAQLAAIIAREGLDTTLRVLTEEHTAWLDVVATTPSIDGVRANYRAPWGTPAHQASRLRGKYSYMAPKGSVNVPGFGISFGRADAASRSVTGSLTTDGVQSHLWLYLFDLAAQQLVIPTGDRDSIIRVPLSELTSTDWTAVECGDGFERCPHYARSHADNVPEESDRLGMRTWLGLDKLTPEDAIGAIIQGERVEFGGGQLRGSTWEMSVKGSDRRVPVFRVSQGRGHAWTPLAGVELIFPRVAGDVVAAV